MEHISNENNRFTQEPYNYQKTIRTSPGLHLGEIHKVNRLSNLFGFYDVRLIDHAGAIVHCQLANTGGGFNGIGKMSSLDVDTPVLVLFKEAQLEYGFIVGTFNTWGEYNQVYEDGKLQDLNVDDEFNQPFIHPNRYTQPDATFEVYADKTKGELAYSSPETMAAEERQKDRPVPGLIKLHNTNGDYAVYTPGQNIQYSEGNIIQVSGGSKTDKVTKLNNFAQAHLQKADNIKGIVAANPEIDYSNTNTLIPLTTEKPNSNQPDGAYLNPNKGNVNNEYLYQEEVKLALAYQQLSQIENSFNYALDSEIERVNESVNQTEKTKEEGKLATSKYIPKLTQLNDLPSGKINLPPTVESKFTYIVFHNAGTDLVEATADLQDTSNLKGYHLLINQDTLVEVTTPNTRVNSVFNLSYNQQINLDQDTYAIGVITNNNNLSNLDYKTIAYAVNDLINQELITEPIYLTHQELQIQNQITVDDFLNVDLDLLTKYVEAAKSL